MPQDNDKTFRRKSPRGTGVVEESRPGRRDPGGAQAGAAKRRTPVRGNHNRNHNRMETGRPGRETNTGNKTGGHTEEKNK